MARPTRKRTPSERTPQWEPTDWQCLGLLLLLVGVYFAKILLGSAFLWEDFTYQWYPFRHFAAVSLANGEIPLWNPYTFNGMPFLAEIQTEVFYLPMTLLTLAVKDGALGVLWLEFVNILHYFLAAAGMFFLARSFGLRRIPALFAAITYAFSGFLVVHAIHQVIIAVVAWFPLLLLLFRKALRESRWTMVFLSGVLLGHSFFGGSPQMSVFFYLFLFSYFLFELFSTFGVRRLFTLPAALMSARAAGVILLSLGVAMVQFLPTHELSDLSVRALITFEKATEGSLAWGQLVTLLVPKLFGVSDAHGYTYWGPGPYWHYWETCIYIGIPALLLTLLSIRLVRVNTNAAFFLGCLVFALLFSLGGNFILHPFFFHNIPGFAAFRNPARMGIFVALGGALLGGMMLQQLMDRTLQPQVSGQLRSWLLVVAGTGLVLLLLVLSGMLDSIYPFLSRPQINTTVRKEVLLAIFLLLATTGTLYTMLARRTWLPALGLALCGITFLDFYLFGASHNTSPDNPTDHFRQAAPIIHVLRQQPGLFRVNTRNAEGMVMDRNQGLIDRIFTMEGYTPLVLRRAYPPAAVPQQTFDLLNIRFYTVTDTVRRTLTLAERPDALPRAFMVFSTLAARSEEVVRSIMSDSAFNPRTTAVVEDTTHQPLVATTETPVWRAQIDRYTNNGFSVTVETDHDGLLVLSEMYYPGWEAEVDHQPVRILQTNYNLRGVLLQRGVRRVDFRFAPESYRRGLLVTLGTLALCLGGLGLSLRRSRTGRVA
jgi:hypothetical protein